MIAKTMLRSVCMVLLAVLSSCGELCDSVANCVAPPEGIFESEKANLALHGVVTTRQQDGSTIVLLTLDSVIVNSSSGSRVITKFYIWTPFEESELITSIDLYSGQTLISIPTDEFLFQEDGISFNAGGHLIYFEKRNDMYIADFKQVTQDFIDGICDDFISDC